MAAIGQVCATASRKAAAEVPTLQLRCPGAPGAALGATGRGSGAALRAWLGQRPASAAHPCMTEVTPSRGARYRATSTRCTGSGARERQTATPGIQCPGSCPPNAGRIPDQRRRRVLPHLEQRGRGAKVGFGREPGAKCRLPAGPEQPPRGAADPPSAASVGGCGITHTSRSGLRGVATGNRPLTSHTHPPR